MLVKTTISKRSERTKSDLKAAFIELIHENGYSHLTITDIVTKSGYNRTTFYLHFIDKNHITEELRKEMFNKVKQQCFNRYEENKRIHVQEMDPYSFELMKFIYVNQDFFNLYIKEDTIPGILQDLPLAIFEALEERFVLTPIHSTSINSKTNKLYMAHGTAGLIIDWIKSGYQASPNEMTQQLIRILQSFVKDFTITSI
ncbi:TetR/AcrR family transcriptional regulator [Bacillus sp. B1-b2]|uniref:TetR/AcrR family transcriptional regulator n=1 Tax=Bacillus sp. B1-b2 TaxID=2653201 RepID=UPI001869F03A|nr:TetR/AcrR family transcriptional regulator [Bacillus sp. B1-b2]